MSQRPLLELHDVPLPECRELPSRLVSVAISPGLTAITGGERTGKTGLLRIISQGAATSSDQKYHHETLGLDSSLPGHDHASPREVWASIATPQWDEDLQAFLIHAWEMAPHIDKALSMLSKGHRRKVGLLAALCSNHTITCIDMPYAALDMRSIGVLRAHLREVARDTTRAWVIADYEADEHLEWAQTIRL